LGNRRKRVRAVERCEVAAKARRHLPVPQS
jgi:hypothetical protein